MPATSLVSPANKQDEEIKNQNFFGSEEAGSANIGQEDAEQKVSAEVSLKSVMNGLETVGFDLEPDHRISFHHPEKKLYVYVGKVCD